MYVNREIQKQETLTYIENNKQEIQRGKPKRRRRREPRNKIAPPQQTTWTRMTKKDINDENKMSTHVQYRRNTHNKRERKVYKKNERKSKREREVDGAHCVSSPPLRAKSSVRIERSQGEGVCISNQRYYHKDPRDDADEDDDVDGDRL